MVLNWWKSLKNRKFGPTKQRPRRLTTEHSGTIRLLVELLEPRLSPSVSSVTVGDFNADGKQDLAVVTANGVAVLIGNGAGGFAAPVIYSAGGSPVSVAVGDFNGDGKRDLAVANASGVSVLLGNGAGGFGAPTSFNVGGSPQSISVGDFNHDGKQDLVVAGADGVSVLLGNGAGGFAAPVTYAAGNSPVFVAVADFNRDGKQDLAVANAGGVSILLGNGAGGFGAGITIGAGSGVTSLGAGDFNGDGKQDLAVANAGGVSVLLGNGAGGFAAPPTFGAGGSPLSAVVGDFNGDGKQDLAAANASGVSVLLGNGAGGFAAAVTYGAGSSPAYVTGGDFNGDGKQDLAVANAGGVTVLRGNGAGGFGPGTTFTASAGSASGQILPGQLSTTTLDVSPNPSAAGLPITLTATVNGPPGSTAPLGAVQFLDGSAVLRTKLLQGGVATLNLTLPPGKHALTAIYLGDGSFTASTSAAVNLIVGDIHERFVAQVYLDLLGRPVDPSGLSFWTGQLDAGTLLPVQVVQAIEASQEFQVVEVNSAYQAALGRQADPSGLSAFVHFLATGGTVEQIKIALAGSPEFFNASQAGANPQATTANQRFVDSLFLHFLNRQADGGALSFFGHQLDTGTRAATVAAEILSSPDGLGAVVNGLFQTLVAHPADQGGLDFWVGELRQGKARDEQIIQALAVSMDYLEGI